MATVNTLKCVFAKANGDKFSVSIKNVKSTLSESDVKLFVQGFVANGGIFTKVPASYVSATLISEDTTTFDLS